MLVVCCIKNVLCSNFVNRTQSNEIAKVFTVKSTKDFDLNETCQMRMFDSKKRIVKGRKKIKIKTNEKIYQGIYIWIKNGKLFLWCEYRENFFLISSIRALLWWLSSDGLASFWCIQLHSYNCEWVWWLNTVI